ncbi:hypothetical protein Q8F55_000375 [Vanrija albida]|uniref:Adhesin domain-containing protein n=1 Tax=Vanrija albida TaxID=181172 RepID=A0ABR3QD36_9TREE
MILPLDTKDPLSDDEDEYVVPPSPVPRVPPYAAAGYTAYDDDPYGPGEDAPFLAAPGDIELAPPPYSVNPEPARKRPPLAQRARTLLARGKFLLAAAYLAFALYLVFGRHRHRHSGRLPFGAWGRPQRPDGVAVACATFSAAQWRDEGSAARSTNATFLLPMHAGAELFAHLHGAAGKVFVTTFDGDSDAEHAAVAGAVGGAGLAKGQYVRVTVEAVYDAAGVAAGVPATSGTSAAWAALEAADVCLMHRAANGTRHSLHHLARPGVGVGVYGAKSEANGSAPLQFRIHVALPVVKAAATPQASLLAAMLDMLRLTRPVQPRGAIPPLSIRVGEADVLVADVRAARLGALAVESKRGDVAVHHVRAETIRLATLGTIAANVTASHMVAVSTPSGQVDLDVSVGRAPAYSFYPRHRHRWSHAQSGADADCALPPLAVDVSVNNANATVRHSGWEVPCRGLSERIVSMVGDVEAYHHPLYQGPFRFASTVGQIDVGVARGLADPLGLGRVRNVTVDAREGVTSGRARWLVAEASEHSDDGGGTPNDWTHTHDRGWAHPHTPGLTIEASVGSVRVEL